MPESAPFTPEQRAYLNGFMAGLFSRAPFSAAAGAPPMETLTPISVLFGSQTGNAENLAKRIAREAGKRGYAATVHELSKYPVAQLASEDRLLIITSTYGDGEPPDNGQSFWTFLNQPPVPSLSRTRFSICALGDSNYPKFCHFGKELDQRLEALGAKRILPRADCDVDFEDPFSKWLNEALGKIGNPNCANSASASILEMSPANPEPLQITHHASRITPLPSPLLTNRKLNGLGSEKDTRHFEIALSDASLSYEVGDALGVIPKNCTEVVAGLLAALKFSGEEPVPGRDGTEVALREALLDHYEITKISPALLKAMAEKTRHDLLQKLTAPGANGELTKFLYGREIVDLVLAHPEANLSAVEFAGLLKKLQPRLYSISSSLKAHPGQVHLTVSVVRYESLGRKRKGVCSIFLSERVQTGDTVPVYVHKNNNFRLPTDPNTPMIMIGPGTGIAPFRAFLQERRAIGAKGRNWLFFGDQRQATDFMYREELEPMVNDGHLHRLSLAFSRDQAEKHYVQHRMREQGKELFDWLEAGAHFYVCGDAARMAKDVDAALYEIIQTAKACTADQASEYLTRLRSEKRYQRDVY